MRASRPFDLNSLSIHKKQVSVEPSLLVFTHPFTRWYQDNLPELLHLNDEFYWFQTLLLIHDSLDMDHPTHQRLMHHLLDSLDTQKCRKLETSYTHIALETISTFLKQTVLAETPHCCGGSDLRPRLAIKTLSTLNRLLEVSCSPLPFQTYFHLIQNLSTHLETFTYQHNLSHRDANINSALSTLIILAHRCSDTLSNFDISQHFQSFFSTTSRLLSKTKSDVIKTKLFKLFQSPLFVGHYTTDTLLQLANNLNHVAGSDDCYAFIHRLMRQPSPS